MSTPVIFPPPPPPPRAAIGPNGTSDPFMAGIICQYCKFLVKKVQFHQLHPEIEGREYALCLLPRDQVKG
jgi:hypothetical protein